MVRWRSMFLASTVLLAPTVWGQDIPAAIANIPLNQWREISQNTLADVDPCPTRDCAYSAVEGQSAVINDWTGGAFASQEGAFGGLVYFGGGHNGYYGNEVYLFDLETLLWQRRNDPTDGQVPGDSTTMGLAPDCRFWDGAPVAPHTYDSVVYDPPRNRFIMLTPSDAVSGPPGRADGCGSTLPAYFDFDTNQWADATGAGPASLIHAPTAYDPNRGVFWGMAGFNSNPDLFVSYDPAADSWTQFADDVLSIDAVGAVDPTRDLFVAADFRLVQRIIVRDLSQPQLATVTVSTTGDSEIEEQGKGIGFEWAPRLGAFLAWNGGLDVHTLNPPPGDWRSEGWTWTRIDNGGPDPGSVPNDSYSKFQWVDELGVALIAPRRDGPVYAVRLVAGTDLDRIFADSFEGPAALSWRAIPDVTLTEGVAASVNLRDFLIDPNGPAIITLDANLPAGLSLVEGEIVGTPAAAAPAQSFSARADDGSTQALSDPFALTVLANATEVLFDRATPEQIAINIPLSSAPPDGTTATVRYRRSGDPLWTDAHPLLQIRPEWTTAGAPLPPSPALAGVIFDLSPGAAYDIEVTIDRPGVGVETIETVWSTRALPPSSGPPTKTANPASDLQATLDSLVPGDVLELAAGVYNVDSLQLAVSGTATQPIVIRGANRDGVVLRDSGRVLQVLEAAHVIIEDMTLEGSGVDSGTAASSRGIAFWDGATQEFITLRRLVIRDVDQAIVAGGAPVQSILVYDSIFRGNNSWQESFIETNLTWNDDGLRLPGQGNAAFQNTLYGFGDSLAVANGIFSAAVFFYRNRIEMTGDDAFEGDYATRNIGFYDNHVQNAATLMSLDPLWGGPLYCFRNIAVNTIRGPFKLNNEQSGFVIYNNTIVRTEGTTGWGWVQFNNGALRNLSYRNNILVYHGSGNLLALESGSMDPIDFSNNGWYPDRSVWWSNSGGSFGSLAAAAAGLGPSTPLFGSTTQRHAGDLLLSSQPFVDAIPLGADHLTEITALYQPNLVLGSTGRGAGVAIPNITDGYTGANPDLGALIEGRPQVSWGAP